MPEFTEQQRSNWPSFQLVFPQAVGVLRDMATPLLQVGVPRSLLYYYKAADTLVLLQVPGYEHLVRFGSSGGFGHMCWEPHMGTILEIHASTWNTRTGAILDISPTTVSEMLHRNSDQAPMFDLAQHFTSAIWVNTSLSQFNACVQAANARFPFDAAQQIDGEDDMDALYADWNRAGDELLAVLRRIDPEGVADEMKFWYNFVWDIRIGIYSSE